MFADVIVDISVEALDRTFQYRIPETLKNEIKIGTPVCVPFGRSNRVLTGFVIGLSQTPLWPVDKIKELLSVSDKKVSLEGQMLQLAAWIHEYYGGTMNEALRTVLPVRRQVKSVEQHWLNFVISEEKAREELEKCRKKHYVAKARLLEGMLQEHGQMTTALAASKYHVTRAVVNGMVKNGILSITEERQYRNPYSGSDFEKKEQPVICLNDEQQRIASHFAAEYAAGIRNTYLLYGVTGSGKTEVYMEMIQSVLETGRQVIVLIPEIALTFQTVSRFRRRFSDRVSILNSRMSEGERFDQYERAKNGEADIIVGPRSALFIPFSNLGLIIIDEEHEGSYKSESTPAYHARETAIRRAEMAGASVVLGSATPSVESMYAARSGRYHLYELKERAGHAEFPQVHVVDLREELRARNRSVFSRLLQKKIGERLERGEQTILFLNRRGYAGFVSCRSCGFVLKCSHCDISMTAHKNHLGDVDTLVCHYCGHAIYMPKTCPSCGSPYIAAFGLGTQKVEEMLARQFPSARILRMDGDTTTGKNGHENILDPFRRGEADILIGTQMIVKGHDFPNVTLVAALAADLSMYTGDYRSNEKTFDLLMQAAGRAGRGDKKGEMVIQTYNPDSYCIEAVRRQDASVFYDNELSYRRLMGYPPYRELVAVLVTSASEELAKACSQELASKLRTACENYPVVVTGPSPAGVRRAKDRFRYVLYVKGEHGALNHIKQQTERFSREKKWERSCSIQMDVNPLTGY